MVRHWIILAFCLPMIVGVIEAANNSSITTETVVLKHGYPFENHTVTTSDGYILTMHRIPHSARVNSTGPRRVVFIMHCLLGSSSDWVLLGLDRALAFLLSDAGYDVWLGNARGNTYSQKHVSLATNSSKFWDFEYREIGLIDLPAMIGYVLEKTGVQKIVYIGHSQGTTAFMVLSSLVPDFNKYFESAHLLSPVAYNNHATSPLLKYAALVAGHPSIGIPADLLGSYEFKPSKKLFEKVGAIICDKDRPEYVLCSNALFLAAVFNNETVDLSILNDVMRTTPAGASTKQFLFYMQIFNSGHFRQFDYGFARNLIKYGQFSPPDYPLVNIDVPIYLYYSENDALVGVEDVEKLMGELPNVVKSYKVPDDKFDHMSQEFNRKVKRLVYDVLLEDILERTPRPTGKNN